MPVLPDSSPKEPETLSAGVAESVPGTAYPVLMREIRYRRLLDLPPKESGNRFVRYVLLCHYGLFLTFRIVLSRGGNTGGFPVLAPTVQEAVLSGMLDVGFYRKAVGTISVRISGFLILPQKEQETLDSDTLLFYTAYRETLGYNHHI